MRNRVSTCCYAQGAPAQPWLSTFSFVVRAPSSARSCKAGLPRDFAIYDDDDQVAAV